MSAEDKIRAPPVAASTTFRGGSDVGSPLDPGSGRLVDMPEQRPRRGAEDRGARHFQIMKASAGVMIRFELKEIIVGQVPGRNV